MFSLIVIAIIVVIVAVLLLATTRPGTFRVQRSTRIHASPAKILALVEDFRAWSHWSPYEKLDPAMRRSYGGFASGEGATYAWDSKGKAGVGRMEITDTSPSRVVIQLEFTKPFAARNVAEFTLKPDGGGTDVIWSMHGPTPFVSKLLGLFVDMDRLVGRDFETGLANLKVAAEK